MRPSPRLLALLPLGAVAFVALQNKIAPSFAQRADTGTLGGPIIAPGASPAAPASPTLPALPPVPLIAKVAPTAAPPSVPLPRFAHPIRVGLSTQGGAVQVWAPGGATLRDLEQPARVQSVAPGSTLSFIVGPPFVQKIGNATFRGSISVQIGGRISQGWSHVALVPAGEQWLRVTSNGRSPRFGRPYRGFLELFPQRLGEPNHRKGPLALVNVVELEDYLKGVVPWEMDAVAPLEALKAQAICARTKTLDFKQTGKFRAGRFDVCDYDACQGYPGTENEKPATTQAVEGTQGLALFHDGRPIDAVYSTNSGGITSAASDVWRGGDVPYLQSVRDFPPDSALSKLFHGGMTEGKWAEFVARPWPSFAAPDGLRKSNYEARKYRWSEFISVEQASRAFASRGLSRVMNIEVEDRASSGRIRRLKVVGVDAEREKLMPTPAPGPTPKPDEPSWVGVELPTKTLVLEGDGVIRSMFSKQLGSTTALPSSLFVVTPQTDASGQVTGWTFSGAGWGHGVGLCQRGAQNHAKAGWNARQILNWYYRGVEIRKLNGGAKP